MHINRVQVEEGFLSGLDLRLPSGLIAIIGARGTGKTSVIELIRYALAARNYTPESGVESLEHARSILEGGEVTVTIDDLFEDIVVTRSASDDAPRASQPFVSPIIFSQKEIETVGMSEAGRLSLIDGFIKGRGEMKTKEAEVANAVRSLYKEMASLEAEIARTASGTEGLPGLRAELATLEAKSTEIQATSELTSEKQARISDLTTRLTALAVRGDAQKRFVTQVEQWSTLLDDAVGSDFGPEEWDGSDPDPLGDLRLDYLKTVGQVQAASASFKAIAQKVAAKLNEGTPVRLGLETEARTLRGEVDKLVEGAGAIARQVTTIRSKIGQLEAVQKVVAERRQRLFAQRKRRDELLNELEVIRDGRYQARRRIAEKLNGTLGPRVGVTVQKFGQFGDYTRAITEALRGSGLKYNELASMIAESVSPRELVRYVEDENFVDLAIAAGLPKDRAARAIGVLREVGLGDIVTCAIDDDVGLRLLDGVEYKDISALSAGQRCTVVLPIVLQHDDRILVIDQPEDHIDNAFITDTLIKSLKARSPESQIIVSTHNANIPVLGEARLIVQMTSDGRNGSVEVSKPLDDPAAVEAITSVMEGGMAAFRDRAAFYDSHGV